MGAAGEQFRRLRGALDVLGGDTGYEIAGKVLEQADAAALRRKGRISRDARLRISVGQEVRRKIRRRAVQLDVFDAAGDLALGRLRKLQFVEDVACNTVIVVGTVKSIEQCA